ncbi:MAG: PASTA domain-containing protein [Candidatus Acidiferrum sp.]|jgi:serine/threonine-protein kinase
MAMTFGERIEWLGRIALLVFILASAAFLSAITAMRIAIHGRETTMPNLVGTNVGQASSLLRSRGLVLKVADHVYSDLPINSIVRQTPTAGMLMKESQQAHVVVSLGQRQLQIPLLEGHSIRASRIELLRNSLQIGEVSAVTMSEEAPDAVVLQNPRPGAGAATPRVDVLVAQAPREASYVMPTLIGQDEIAAQHRLDAAHLNRKVNYVSAPQWPHAAVIDQTPAPGARLSASTQVELTIAN